MLEKGKKKSPKLNGLILFLKHLSLLALLNAVYEDMPPTDPNAFQWILVFEQNAKSLNYVQVCKITKL